MRLFAKKGNIFGLIGFLERNPVCIRLPDSSTMSTKNVVSCYLFIHLFTVFQSFFLSEKAHIPCTFRVKRDTSVKGGHSGFIVNSSKQVSAVAFLMFKALLH